MSGVVPHPNGALDDDGDARKRPEVGGKAVSTRTLQQFGLDTAQIVIARERRTAPPRGSAKGTEAALAPLFVPATGALPGHAQRAADLGASRPTAEEISGGPSTLVERRAITGVDGHLALSASRSGVHEHMFAHYSPHVTSLRETL